MFLERNNFAMTLLIFTNFVSASVWKCHALFRYYIHGIEEIDIIIENLCYTTWYLNRNNCVVKTIFIVCLLLQSGMNASRNPLTTIFIVPFFGHLFIWQDFTLSWFSTGLLCWWSFMLSYEFIKLNVKLLLISVWCLTCWERPTYIMLVNVLAITSVYLFQG